MGSGRYSIEVKKNGRSHYLDGTPTRGHQEEAERLAWQFSQFPTLVLRGGRETIARPFQVIVVNTVGNYVCAGYVAGERTHDVLAQG